MALSRIPVAIAVLAALHGAAVPWASGCEERQPAEAAELAAAARTKRSPQELLELAPRGEEEVAAVLLRDLPWHVLALPAVGKREDGGTGYTPRLGRESGEEQQQQQDLIGGDDSGLLEARTPPFAPRLGRRTEEYIPRMGRARPVRASP